MTDEMKTPKEHKLNQYRNLLIVLSVLVAGAVFLYYLMDEEQPEKHEEKLSFSSPIEKVDAESVWRERAQNKLKEQERKTEELKHELSELKNTDISKSIEADPKFQALQKQNEVLQEAFKKINENKEKKITTDKDNPTDQGRIFSSQVGARMHGAGTESVEINADLPTGIDNDELKLESTSLVPSKNKDTYVPSGTFSEAIMLGAADASAGVQASSDPTPMLFRIIADGTLPNGQKSHLKDCMVTAAVVGDISSERGQVRLERMSCTFPNGEIVEQQVDGTIFGMDAKNGVRGNPVWREGSLLNRAMVAGTLSGFSSAISQKYTTTSISPLGSTQSVNNGDIAKYAGAQGLSNAMEKLADYNIRRAEQYHPVIQLSAGQQVDIVFLCGFFLDGRKHEPCARNEDRETSASGSLFSPPAQSTSGTYRTSSGITLSHREAMRLKENQQYIK